MWMLLYCMDAAARRVSALMMLLWFWAEGAKEEELDAIEAQIGCKLPSDYRCSYRIHNGQKLVVPG